MRFVRVEQGPRLVGRPTEYNTRISISVSKTDMLLGNMWGVLTLFARFEPPGTSSERGKHMPYDSARIIRELANAVIDLRTAQFVSQGTPADLARHAAIREMDAYLQRMSFTVPELVQRERGMRVPGGATSIP